MLPLGVLEELGEMLEEELFLGHVALDRMLDVTMERVRERSDKVHLDGQLQQFVKGLAHIRLDLQHLEVLHLLDVHEEILSGALLRN